MIGSLRGRLLERGATEVIVEVGGIGYRVSVSPATTVAIGDPGDEVFLHVHHHVREDADLLYGFPTLDERMCFEALIGAHGVGPSLALAILSVHDPEALRRALADDDLDALCLVPGVPAAGRAEGPAGAARGRVGGDRGRGRQRRAPFRPKRGP
jgi:Holliday junction DNA helicase RuvA